MDATRWKAANTFCEEVMTAVVAYEARTFARRQVNARSRMALFFTALERDLQRTAALPVEGAGAREAGYETLLPSPLQQ